MRSVMKKPDKIPPPALVRKWVEDYGIAQCFDLDDATRMLLDFAGWANFNLEEAKVQELLYRWKDWVRLHRAEKTRSEGEKRTSHMVMAECFDVAATELEIAVRNQLIEQAPKIEAEGSPEWYKRKILLLESRVLDLEQSIRLVHERYSPLLEKEDGQ